MDSSIASLNPASQSQVLDEEEVRPYKIHVSSKYLDLTRKKLELTRLPHELKVDREEDGDGDGEVEERAARERDRTWEMGTPKGEIEPLVDFWLETYTWRPQETHLNTLPQFRTAFSSLKNPPQRLHFIHIPSSSPVAIPLLLIPSFPLTNLSLEPLFSLLKEDFHIVVPNIPGLGFSDAYHRSFTSDERVGEGVLMSTAILFDRLMTRLGYYFYLTSATSSGKDSPSGIDYHLPVLMGERFEGCLGVHILDPCISEPEIGKGLGQWMKWRLAEFFHGGWFGYDSSDWSAISRFQNRLREEKRGYSVLGRMGLREPNTFSYALCDSPVGLLSFVLSALRKRSPEHGLEKEQIIKLAQLAWLPGPEAAMRFWASAVEEVEVLEKRERVRTRVAVTVFGSDGVDGGYICPAWASGHHDVVFSQRVNGRAGLLVWERSEVLVEGIRGLARAIVQVDSRLKVQALQEVVVVPVEEPIREEVEVMTESEFDEYDGSVDGLQLEVESPDTVVAVPTK